LEVQKIHACPNDYILYQGTKHENLEACLVCKALRYKIRIDDDPGAPEGTPPKNDESTGEGYVVFSYNTLFEAFVQEQRKC
jgi:hypothetical protein